MINIAHLALQISPALHEPGPVKSFYTVWEYYVKFLLFTSPCSRYSHTSHEIVRNLNFHLLTKPLAVRTFVLYILVITYYDFARPSAAILEEYIQKKGGWVNNYICW